MIEITSAPLNIPGLISVATHPAAGGLNVFIGNIRDFNSKLGKKVIRLEYEAYMPMAISEIRQILDIATPKFNIIKCAISHRTGSVCPGEAAVVIAVSTAHRKESFEACQFLIDNIKEKVPIWKKEVFDDGSEWV